MTFPEMHAESFDLDPRNTGLLQDKAHFERVQAKLDYLANNHYEEYAQIVKDYASNQQVVTKPVTVVPARKIRDARQALINSCSEVQTGKYDVGMFALACSYSGSVALLARFVNARLLRSNALNVPFIVLTTFGLGIIPSYSLIQRTRLTSVQQSLHHRFNQNN